MQQINVNKLAGLKYFSVADVKQLLPIHQSTAIDNLRIIFQNYTNSKYPKSIFILPDQNLTLGYKQTISYFSDIKGIWCQDFDQQPDILKNSLSFAASLLNFCASIDEDSSSNIQQDSPPLTDNYNQRIEIFSILGGDKVQVKQNQYKQLKLKKTLLGIKFHKQRGKLYAILGINHFPNQGLALACANLRLWNLKRLKIGSSNRDIEIDFLHRICQHLFCTARNFTREASDDFNTYHGNLEKLISSIQQDDITNKSLLCEKFKELKLNPSNIEHEAVIIASNVVFRNQMSQQQIWAIVSKLVIQWLVQTPINVPCSFASYLDYQEKNNAFFIVLSSHYQSSPKNIHASPQNLSNGTKSIQQLLFNQMYKKNEPTSALVHQNMNPAINILGKTHGTQNDDLVLLRQMTPTQNNPNSSLNQSMFSQKSGESLSNKSSSMKEVAKLENQLYQILKLIDAKKKILHPTEIENIIRSHIRLLKKLQISKGVNEQQFAVLEVFNEINEAITAEDLYLVLKHNITQHNLIVPYFLQRNRYTRSVEVGKKLAKDHLDSLYKSCLKSNMVAWKHTIIPCYLKRMVQAYSENSSIPKNLKIDEVATPQLIEIIQKKNYESHFYANILSILYPQLFVGFQAIIKLLSPLLHYFVDHLIKLDHHQQLVFSFIGDLLFEICYFTRQGKMSMLNNSVYLQDKSINTFSLKQKKILEMIREGGLKGFGFEIKSQLYPIFQSNKNFVFPDKIIYLLIKIQKPSELIQFFRLLGACHYTPIINQISKYLDYHNYYKGILQTSSNLSAYFLSNAPQNKTDFKIVLKKGEMNEEKRGIKEVNVAQFDSIAERILRSESGIFQDMVRLNPNVKIAGVELKTAIKNLSTSRKIAEEKVEQKRKGFIDQEQAVKHYVNERTFEEYEYIELAQSLKQKYTNYHILSQGEKSYFKQCAKSVVDHKQQIVNYVGLSSKMKMIQNELKQVK